MRLFERFSNVVDYFCSQGSGPAFGQAHVPLLALMPSRSADGADATDWLPEGDEA